MVTTGRVQTERADKISKEEKSIYEVSILRKSIGGQKKCFLYYFKFKDIYIHIYGICIKEKL